MANIICSPGVWARYRQTAVTARALIIRGRVETADNVTNVIADRLEALEIPAAPASRDFR